MSLATDCCGPCDPVVSNVPGVQGDDGTPGIDGSNGISAFTLTTDDEDVNAPLDSITFDVAQSDSFAIGQHIFISDGTDWGTFIITAIGTATSITATFQDAPGDTATPFNLASGSKVTPAGATGALSAALPTAITDNSTGTASNTIAAGVGIHTITIPLTSLATGLGVLAIDLLTDYILGYKFKLLSFDFVTTVVGAGAGATQTFNLEIGAVDVTNTLTVTLASTATIGAVTAGVPNPIVATNTGTAANTLSIEMAAGGTVFTSGAGYFVIKVQNMDEADSAASMADHINDLILALS